MGRYLVIILLACGLAEFVVQRGLGVVSLHAGLLTALAPGSVAVGGLGALCWTAFKVGALSYGGGFVIIPLMQGDAVHTYHWMTDAEFVNAVALGQVTPGPVVATIAAVGYAAHGLGGGLLAASVAFTPSFSFILLGGQRFRRVRESVSARAFLAGAGPAAIGAIAGACVPLTGALAEPWQFAVLAAAGGALLILRRSVVAVLLCAGVVGVVVALAGGPLP
jgi:chromate transporter